VTGGTDNHLLLWDVKSVGLTGSKVEKACDFVGITVNKNMIPGDTSAAAPGGIRLGTPALTSRGFIEKDFDRVADILHRIVVISIQVQKDVGKQLADFTQNLGKYEALIAIKKEVLEFSGQFGMPGF